jgi:hypothetical protein
MQNTRTPQPVVNQGVDPVPRFPLGYSDDFEATFLSPAAEVAKSGSSMNQILRAVKIVGKRIVQGVQFDVGAHNIEGYVDAIKAKIDLAAELTAPKAP